jgi:RHS repeat-associated protein
VASFIQTEDGRVFPYSTDSTNYYEYNLADHLGNNRIAFDNPNSAGVTVEQQDNYMPFGLEIPQYVNTPKNESLYNGKELQEGFQLYDYGARFYDPVIGRFTTIDRFAEKYKSYSSYVYTLDNPIKTIDINGDSSVVLNSPHGAHGEGHMAQLIQGSDGEYHLYSKNGTNESPGLSGPNDEKNVKGASGNDVGTGSYKTPKDFMNSSSNPVIDKKTGEREYSEGFVIPATKEQDKQNIAGEKKVLSEPYDVINSSCGTAVQSGLKAEGKNAGDHPDPLIFNGIASMENKYSPNKIYQRIKKENKRQTVTPGN